MGAWNGSSWRNKGIEEEEEEQQKQHEQELLLLLLLLLPLLLRNLVNKSHHILYFQNAVRFLDVGALKSNFIHSHKKITVFHVPICTNLSSAQSTAWISSMISPRSVKNFGNYG